jgi:2-oxoglutarate dehydrogenase E2 component (dihydrolipoamide succinyltransferase)
MERVTMPQLGETVTEGTITRWLKQVGDAVAVDDVLFEVSTDKVDTEVPSAFAGFLREVYVPEGDTVPIGTLLALITDTADEPLEPAAAGLTDAPSVDDEAAPSAEPGAAPASAAAPTVATAPRATRAPVSAPPRRGDGVAAGDGGGNGAGTGFLSPVVQRLLAEHGLAPGDVVGSGREGRITRADVLAAAANRRRGPGTGVDAGAAAAPGAPAGVAATVGAVIPADLVPGPDDEVVELSRARRNTAANMMRSLATSAHTLVVVEVDYHAIDPVRRRAGLSFLPFVCRAVVDALAEFPHVNASFGDGELIVHRTINLGVAVDVDFQALVVPVVKDAAGKRLRALSDEIADLANRARNKRLTADDLSGGTFTVTNVGSYGTVVTGPIINQPQVGILSSDGVKMRPVAVRTAAGEWTVAIHPTGNLSLTFDHRAYDGAYAAAFLARVRELLETRDWSQEV